MTSLALVLATALFLGALHAFDADHLAAMTSFVARNPSRRAAVGFAARWGLGHGATMLVVGLAAGLFSLTLASDVQAAAELAVGVTLTGVGIWVLAGMKGGRLRMQRHRHREYDHAHLHAPDHGHPRRHGHAIFWIGALHGLAGSAGLLVVIPVGMMASPWAVMVYVITFSLGVTAAMALYTLSLSRVFRLAGARGAGRWYPWVAGVTGCLTLLMGLCWISLTLAGRLA